MTMTVNLQYPIEHGGNAINRLELRRLNTSNMLLAAKNASCKEEVGFLLLSMSAQIPPESLINLDLADFISAQAALVEMMGIAVPGFDPS